MVERKVLLVDGDPDTREILCALFQHHGFRVLVAEDAPEGLRLAREEAPDLVIRDHPLPLPTGGTLAQALRSDPATASIPVLTLTARLSTREEEQAARRLADAFLHKPAYPDSVLQEARRLLELPPPPRPSTRSAAPRRRHSAG